MGKLDNREVWQQVQDECNCSVGQAKYLSRRVLRLVRNEAYSIDRAIEKVLSEAILLHRLP